MASITEQVVSGLAAGGVYALVAVALVVVHRSSGVVNLAQGELATLSAFGCASLVGHGWAFWPAFGVTIVLSFAGGAVVHTVLVRPVQSGPLPLLFLLTAGLFLAVNGLDTWIWGTSSRSFPGAFAVRHVTVGGLTLGRRDLGVLGVALGVAILVGLLHGRTRLGLGLRAAAANPAGARYAGVHVGSTIAAAWGLATALGAVAAILAAPSLRLEPNMMRPVLLYGLAAASAGGLESTFRAVVVALGLGVAVELIGVHVHALQGGIGPAVGLAVLAVGLAVRRP
jgi:branched-chain amino acid transport system permease protein